MAEYIIIAILSVSIIVLEVAHSYNIKSVIRGFLSRNAHEYVVAEDKKPITNPEGKAEKVKRDWRNPNKGVDNT